MDANSDEEYIKIANSKLEELNKITDTVSLTLLADYQMHRGVIIPLKRDDLELNDRYLIKTSDHIISDSKETVTIKIEKYTGNLEKNNGEKLEF